MHATLYTATHNPAAVYTHTQWAQNKNITSTYMNIMAVILKFHTIWLKHLSQTAPSSYGLHAKECANVLMNQQQ